MSEIIYNKVNDMSDVELAMANIIAQCDTVLDYITASTDSKKNKLDNISYLLMNLHDYTVVAKKQVNALQRQEQAQEPSELAT